MSVAEFQKLHDEMRELRAKGELAKMNDFSSEDAVFSSPMHGTINKQQIAEMTKASEFNALSKIETTNTVADVKVYGEIAIDRGEFTAQMPPNGEKKTGRRVLYVNIYLMVWRKDGNRWKMINGCTNIHMPMPCLK